MRISAFRQKQFEQNPAEVKWQNITLLIFCVRLTLSQQSIFYIKRVFCVELIQSDSVREVSRLKKEELLSQEEKKIK